VAEYAGQSSGALHEGREIVGESHGRQATAFTLSGLR